MQTYNDDAEEETLSLSKFYKEDDDTISSQGSSSSSSLSDQDQFLGFFSDETNGKTSSYGTLPENIVFCGKVISSGEPIIMARNRNNEVNNYKSTQTASWPLFRSSSDSFRFMRMKTSSIRPSTTRRSKSLPNRSAYSFPYKSKLMVFMFGSGSSKYLQQVEMRDIKIRQLRRQNTMTAWPGENSGKTEDNGGQKSGMSKGWWRVVDVLGCGGGYQKDTNYLGVI